MKRYFDLSETVHKIYFFRKDARPARWEPPGGSPPVRDPVESFLEKKLNGEG
jgi:hypothetical protein